MKLVGVILIILSAGWVGLGIAGSLRKRCKLIRQLLTATQMLENEICSCGTPLPQAFALAAVSSEGIVGQVFSAVAKEMDRRRWIPPRAAMAQVIQNIPEFGKDESISEVLLYLTGGLGKYDRENQLQTLTQTKLRLEEMLRSAEQECSVRSKTYEVLGICAGISVAILLI